MKFTKNVPEKDGWYWVAIRYSYRGGWAEPWPRQKCGDEWESEGEWEHLVNDSTKTYFFGDRLETPEMELIDD